MTAASQALPAPAPGGNPADAPPAAALQYLTFILGKRTFAISIEAVTEIIRFGRVTRVPRTAPSIRGIINLRGSVLPVLDLNIHVGQSPADNDAQTCIVVITVPGLRGPHTIGLLVDAVAAVMSIDQNALEPVPPFGVGLRPHLLQGIFRVQERFILVFDVETAFSTAALSQAAVANAPLRLRSTASATAPMS